MGREDRRVRDSQVLWWPVCAYAYFFCEAKRIFWVCEQPCNSLMEGHPSFQMLLRLAGVCDLSDLVLIDPALIFYDLVISGHIW